MCAVVYFFMYNGPLKAYDYDLRGLRAIYVLIRTSLTIENDKQKKRGSNASAYDSTFTRLG